MQQTHICRTELNNLRSEMLAFKEKYDSSDLFDDWDDFRKSVSRQNNWSSVIGSEM